MELQLPSRYGEIFFVSIVSGTDLDFDFFTTAMAYSMIGDFFEHHEEKFHMKLLPSTPCIFAHVAPLWFTSCC